MNTFAGGNVVPNAKPVTLANFNTVRTNLEKILPAGIAIFPIGSAGHKEISKDLDVLIDAGALSTHFLTDSVKASKKKLEEYFTKLGYFSKMTGVSVHVGIPTGENNDITQVDIMVVENAKEVWPLHVHEYTSADIKGGTLHAMWADLANLSSLPNHPKLMISPYKGLLDRNTRELISSNKNTIASIIVSKNATKDDLSSVSRILNLLQKNSEKYNLIYSKYYKT
jgi:hypothetical protein